MQKTDLKKLRAEIKKSSDKKQAAVLRRFFKTAPGEYGEGDVFAGIKVPVLRKIAHKFKDISYLELGKAVKSKIHEERLISLFILVAKYEEANEAGKEKAVNFFIKHRKYINNWDLVDLSAPKILGDYLLNKDKTILYEFARSKNLWERRIAVLSTFRFIRENKFEPTFRIAKVLLKDEHDLIHKAVGWMLRETGKRNLAAEEKFLKKYYKGMPRTMFRYAIERFPENKRKAYLAGKI